MANRGRAQILMSGGIDSAACAKFLIDQGIKTSALFVDYGQAAAVLELEAVQRIAKHYDVALDRIKVTHPRQFGAGEVPGRNMLLVLSALTFGQANAAIALGIHAGTDYWDCSNEFVAAVGSMVERASHGERTLITPFVDWTKRDVYDFAISRAVPIDITYSCEAGLAGGCGECRSCADRRVLGCLQST